MAAEPPRLAEHTPAAELLRLLGTTELSPELTLALASILRRLDELERQVEALRR